MKKFLAIAHSIKGAARTVYLRALASTASETEEAAKDARLAHLPGLLAELKAKWQRAEEKLRAID